MFIPFLRCSTRTPRIYFSQTPFRLVRSYTSSPTTLKARTVAPKPSNTTSSASSSSTPRSTSPLQTPKPTPSNILQTRNKTLIAEQILNAGREEIYKAPSHLGLLTTAWAVFASGSLCCMYFLNSGFLDTEKMKTRNLPVWVPFVYKIVVAFMGVCSGVFLAQSFSFVSAVKIVKDGGKVRLLVSQRPWFPVWRHHRFLVEPGRLAIDRRVAVLAQQPGAGRTVVGQQALLAEQEGGLVKRMVVKPFLIMRKLFFHEGVLKVVIPTGKDGSSERWVRLDLDGQWSNHGKDLLDIATIRTG